MIQPVYNYLLTTYTPKTKIANRTHKPSELRNLYSRMTQLNQKSPLYKVNMTTDTQVFALSLKEASMELGHIMSDMDTAFSYTKAVSENPDSASAQIIEDSTASLPEEFKLQVHSLASPQVNTGSYVPAVMLSAAPHAGSYSFTIENEDTAYEFQFNIKESSKNEDILTKLKDFINKSQVGIRADILHKDNTLALQLTSEDTGDTGEPIFTLQDTKSPEGSPGLAAFYHLNTITSKAASSSYSINGEEHTGLTNHLVLNRSLQVDLTAPSEEAFSIGYGPDTRRILSRLEQFKDSFNYTIQLARNFGAKQPTANRVITELRSTVLSHRSEMESAGLSLEKDGTLRVDKALASESIESQELNSLFSKENGPIRDLINKTNYITINPMDYVDKLLVTYPNPLKPAVGHPYNSSIYSGLLFNYYC